MKGFACTLFVSAALCGWAQVGLLETTPHGFYPRAIQPLRWAKYVPGQPIVWHERQANQSQGLDAPSWLKAYDTINWNTALSASDPAGMAAKVYQANTPRSALWTYSNSGSTYFANLPYIVDDMVMPSTTARKFAERLRVAFIWNPEGEAASSGSWPSVASTKNCVMLIGTCSGVGGANGPAISGLITTPFYQIGSNLQQLSGYLVDFGPNPGFWFADFKSTDFLKAFQLPLPGPTSSTGGIVLALGKERNGAFVPLGAAQGDPANAAAEFWLMSNCAPGDPYQPGTNATDSDPKVWMDGFKRSATFGTEPNDVQLVTPDFGFDTVPAQAVSELSDLNFTSSTFFGGGRELHPAIGLAVDTTAALATIPVDFDGLDVGAIPTHMVLRVIAVDAGGTPLLDDQGAVLWAEQEVAVDITGATGRVTVINPHLKPNANAAEASHYIIQAFPYRALRATTVLWSAASGSATLPTLQFKLGDVDHDNAITVFDYGILSDSFDVTSADSSWLIPGPSGFAPVDADLDNDGVVSVFDYGYISVNFDQSGSNDLSS